MGYSVSKRQLDQAMKAMDTDGSGDVDFDEFSVWFMKQDTTKQEGLYAHTCECSFFTPDATAAATRITVYYQAADGSKAQTTMAGVPELRASGAINARTLVWIEGMESWTALGDAKEFGITDALQSAVDGASQETQKKLLMAVWEKCATLTFLLIGKVCSHRVVVAGRMRTAMAIWTATRWHWC